jgi:hypothetical protein
MCLCNDGDYCVVRKSAKQQPSFQGKLLPLSSDRSERERERERERGGGQDGQTVREGEGKVG